MSCPVCGSKSATYHYDTNTIECDACGWENNCESDKKEEKITPPTRCPNCGSMLRLSDAKLGQYEKAVYECPNCRYKYKVLDIPKQSNPYTDFAKEMSLLHEALKAEGFKDAMVDILAAMSPVVWDRVRAKEACTPLRKRNARRYGAASKEVSNENITQEVKIAGGENIEVNC